MSRFKWSSRYVISVTILVALVLEIMPLPHSFQGYRPDWVLLVLCYWAMALPARVNVGVAFICGVLMDILLGTTLGVHALALSVVIFIIAANYQRFRNYSVWQQAFIVAVLSALYRLVVFWIQHILSDVYFTSSYMWPVLFNLLFWIWVFPLMRRVRRHYRVN